MMLSRASLLSRRSISTQRRRFPPASTTSVISSRSSINNISTGRFFTTSHQYQPTQTLLSPPTTQNNTSTHHTKQHHPINTIQTRTFAGRKDRASTTYKQRKPTRKQLKTYHRRRRKAEYEVSKHSKPNSKAAARRIEDEENTQRLIDIAKEEELLKGQLKAYYNKVNELQSKIEASPKFIQLLESNKLSKEQIKEAARDAAKKAANKSDTPHPPLPSWIQDRMTYDWGDALIDDLMGNSSDLTSSVSPFPVYMGKEYGMLKRKVGRLLREKRLMEEEGQLFALDSGKGGISGEVGKIEGGDLSNISSQTSPDQSPTLPVDIQHSNNNTVSDKLISDLIRSHRDAHGKRTSPIGLASTLHLLHELQIPLSTIQTYSYVSLLTCCKSPWEGRKVNELRKEYGIPSNEYYWSALVDVYARSGDYRGAENVLDEMLAESKLEANQSSKKSISGQQSAATTKPISIPPLPAYTSFFSSCYKLISRIDVHQSIKSDAANRAWERWKEMRINSVAPDVMAYGSLMRIFAAQGRPEKCIDLLDEIMMQLMMPVNADGILQGKDEILRSIDGDGDGFQDNVNGETVRVKPTTLLFTSALKAVAKSHEVASKFNGGNSKKNRRRESITSYHGRLTRKIVVMAEQAEVKQDDGFVSALMLCAAAAGDSSTARAIYLASKVRRMDHLRTCGGVDHLNRLQGLIPEDEKQKLLGDSASSSMPPALSSTSSKAPALRSIEEEFVEEHEAYEHREYGNDTRILSALMLAHSKAMEPKGLGSMWAGKINRGYLCPNSLRYIEAYNIPQMENMAIPGLDSVKAGLSPEGNEAEDFFDDKTGKSSKALRKKHKFNIQQIMDDGFGNRKDEQDSFFDGFDPNDEDDWRIQLRRGNYDEGGNEKREPEVTRDWLSDQMNSVQVALPSSSDGMSTVQYKPNQNNGAAASSEASKAGSDYTNDFDSDSDDDDSDDEEDLLKLTPHDSFVNKQQQQQQQQQQQHSQPPGSDRQALVKAMAEVTNDLELAEDLIPKDLHDPMGDEVGEEEDFDAEGYFDEEAFYKLMDDTKKGIDDSVGGDAEELNSIPGVASNDFEVFKAHLKDELIAEGSTNNVNDTEARDLFDMMRTYYDEGSTKVIPDEGEIVSGESIVNEEQSSFDDLLDSTSFASMDMAKTQLDNLKNESQSQERAVPQMQRSSSDNMGSTMPNETIYADDYLEWANSQSEKIESSQDTTQELSEVEPSVPLDIPLPKQYTMSPLEEQEDPHIKELQETLPGLPMNRIEKVSDEFARTLGYPSILRLAVAVRENMPEAFSPQCLARVNLLNAKHIMAEAEKEGLIDAHLLNGMLRVHANSGRIEPALRFYDTEYKRHGIARTTHSDRLLLEMLVKKKRIARAYKLKQDIEKEGRSLDILSYGTMVEHYGKQNQLGSALMLIKECIDKHGSPPGEKSLKKIRLICRQNNLTEQVGLEKMVGKDPLEWMRRGEELKRVQNKRGKSSDLLFGVNRLLDI